jgi:hypothetical protein
LFQPRPFDVAIASAKPSVKCCHPCAIPAALAWANFVQVMLLPPLVLVQQPGKAPVTPVLGGEAPAAAVVAPSTLDYALGIPSVPRQAPTSKLSDVVHPFYCNFASKGQKNM